MRAYYKLPGKVKNAAVNMITETESKCGCVMGRFHHPDVCWPSLLLKAEDLIYCLRDNIIYWKS